MLDPALLRKDLLATAQRLADTRGAAIDTAAWAELEARRAHAQTRAQELRHTRTQRSADIGRARQAGQDTSADQMKMAMLSEAISQEEAVLDDVQAQLRALALRLPNLPAEDVPLGPDETANVEVLRWGEPRERGFAPRSHVELAGPWLDAPAGAALAGSRFTVLRGPLARLHRALAQFMLDLHTTEHGYQEVNVPVLVNPAALEGTGQLPKFEDDLFAVGAPEERRYLIPTSEVPLTNLVRDQILEAAALPMRLTAHSLCFRAEAGAGGRDMAGLMRQHQFEKVELVSVVAAQDSATELERMTLCAEMVLQRLGLPYRRVLLCTGDMGFSARKTYDLEVWMPGQATYREISSCSNCGDFQARRLQARWRNPATGKPELVHTLNGSGVAVGRALIAVLENFQRADGRLDVPPALRPYLGGLDVMAFAAE